MPVSEAALLHRPAPPASDVPLPLAHVLRIADEYDRANRCDEAEDLLREALRAAPQLPSALYHLGLIAFRKGRMHEAAQLLEQAIAGGADLPLAFRDICVVYERLGRHDEAILAGQRAVELAPYDPHAYHNLTVAYRQALRLDESVACARRALALDPALPAPHVALAEALLLRGDLEAGWDEYEWRFRIPGVEPLMPPTERPHWDGTPMPGSALLLVADQGFGDVIQFSRYLPWVAQRCANVVLACGTELLPLVRHNHPWLHTFSRWESCPDFGAYCPLSGLPRLCGTRLDTIPADVPYLRAEPSRAAAWEERLRQLVPPGYRRVGIAWAGRPQPPNRSTSLQALAPIAALDGIALVSLQMGQAQQEVGGYFGRVPLVSLGHEITDFMESAAIIANLDSVVTIDTAVGHLAAAMGKAVSIVLPYSPDWRWLLDRDDSPWYPTARLFRQPSPGQWTPVLARVAEELRSRTAASCSSERAPPTLATPPGDALTAHERHS